MARNAETTAPSRDTRDRSALLADPERGTLWASLTYALFTVVLGYGAFAGQFLVNARSDQYIAGFAFRDFAAQSLKSGHGIPQWNPFLQGGLPYIAAMHGDIFYPTALLRWILPTDVAMTWEFMIHLFLCGLFTYLFLRAWGFGFWSALLGGASYMLGGSIAGYASPGHDGKLFVSTMLPALLLALTRGVRDGRTWAWGATAAVVGLALLSPHPQLSQYLLLAGGAFAIYAAFSDWPGRGKLSTRVAVTRLGFALGAVVLGMLIAAIQYLPVVEYTPWSPRTGGHDWVTATSFSYPIEETLNWFWPQFSGILDQYWGRNFPFHYHSDFFGVVVLMLAGAAFGATTRTSFRRFWIGVGIVSLLWAFGGFTPLYHVIAAIVPGTMYFRAPSTMIFVTAFSVAILAAVGVERLLENRVSVKYPLIWAGAAGAFALLMSVGGYTALVSMVGGSVASEYPEQIRSQVVDMITQRAQPNASSAIFGVWRSFLFAALAAGVMWLLIQGRIAAKQAVIALVVVLAVDLWSIERLYWIFSPPASALYATDPAIDAIKADIAKTGQPGRVLNPAAGSGLASWEGRPDRTFSGDALMIHGIRVDEGYHGNELGMYDQLTQLDSGNVRFSPAYWRHENIQYWYSAFDDTTIAGIAKQIGVPLIKLAGPVRNAVGSMVYAYKMADSYPFATVASAMVRAPQNQALATIVNPRFDPATVAIIDTTAKDVQTANLTTAPAPTANRTTVGAYAPGLIDITLDQPAAAGQALVVSENYFPGWRATVDGKAAPVALTNYNLIGVPLPAGAKTIQLRFTDAAYIKGKTITWIAAIVALLLWVGGAVIDRRRVTQAPVAA
jgi:hypothetical protein